MDASFPARFPIFPLPNVVLFPDAYLQLKIFEPRYRAMTRDALLGDRVIGMTLLKTGSMAAVSGPAHIFELGCAGRITNHKELPDGKYDILLEGQRRFRVLGQEPTEDGYIIARTELLDDPSSDELAEATRDDLLAIRPELEEKMLAYAKLAVRSSVEQLRKRMRELDPVSLVHAIAFGVDCGLVEKQSLLETADPLARARLLIQLLDFQLAAARLPDRPDSLN
jgi:Lon protease-like protein